MKTTLLLTALLFSMGNLNAQRKEVLNLAPDGPGDPALVHRMLAAYTSRAPLNISGDIASQAVFVPSCANVAGLNGAFYKTELQIATHWAASSKTLWLSFTPNGPPPFGGGLGRGLVGKAFTVVGNTTYVWENILSTLGVDGAGLLYASVLSTGNLYEISVWANTYTASPSGGFYRTPIPVLNYNIGTQGQSPVAFYRTAYPYLNGNLTQDSSTRNNVFVANVGIDALTLSIYAFQNGVSQTPATVTLAPGESEQYSFASLFPGVTGSGIDIQYVPNGVGLRTAPFWLAYCIRTDNVTNDGMIELPELYDTVNWLE